MSATTTPVQSTATTSTDSSRNPYLQGNYGPVSGETSHQDLAVEGALPPSLDGLLLRDGPNPVGTPGPEHHWFIGDGMLHGIAIEKGRATGYRNRWVRTPKVQDGTGLSAVPVREDVPTSTGGVNVIGHGGRILALGEVGLPFEMDRQLNTVRQFDYDGRLNSSMTAHPKIDPVSGELIFFGYDFGPVHLRYHVADSDGNLVHSAEIATPRPTMMHDFGVTATRVVFMDFPVVFDLNIIASGGHMPFRWDDDAGARLGIMARDGDGSQVQWIETDPCYVYHPLNAYDDGQRIVLDVVRHERTFAESSVGPEDSTLPRLERWVIDPAAGHVSRATLSDRGQEFPRVDPRIEGRRHRYGYATEVCAADRGQVGFGNLFKHDLDAGTTQVHDLGPGRVAGEGIFVPEGDGEDEGHVLSVVYDANTDTSDVVVIDATRFEAPPVAVIHLPVRVPFGFHGNWIPNR